MVTQSLSIFPAQPLLDANYSRRWCVPRRVTNSLTALNYSAGNHTFKFGGDLAFVRIPSAIFQLNFAGLFNFGGLSATTLGAFPGGDCSSPTQAGCAPAFTPVQQYGLGFPTNFIQGFGDPVSRLKNKPIALFAQDSWKIRPNLTLNYGVRYDIEIPQTIAPVGFKDPLSGITLSASDVLAAQDALGCPARFSEGQEQLGAARRRSLGRAQQCEDSRSRRLWPFL